MSANRLLNQKKPANTAKYLVLKDLIEGIDVRAKVDSIHYMTSRIENVKNNLKKEGLEFQEDVMKRTAYSHYKPYLLVPSVSNISKAKKMLKNYQSKEILEFLSSLKFISHE